MKRVILMCSVEGEIQDPVFFMTMEDAHTEMVSQYKAAIKDAEDEGGYNDVSAYCVNSNHDNVNWRIMETDVRASKPTTSLPRYTVTGPRDSNREGWFGGDMRQTARIELMTENGDIIAEVGGDSDFPEMWIGFRKKGTTFEQNIACVGTDEMSGYEGTAPACGVTALVYANSNEPAGDATDVFRIAACEDVCRGGDDNV